MRMISTLVLTVTLSANAAFATPGLSKEADINAGLLAVGIADEIRKNCDSISARMFKALSYMNGLEKMARDKGYSQSEIDAYVTSATEKAKMRAKGETYLADHGVDRSTPETFCELGRAEIANGSQIGAFLRAK